MRSRWRPIAAVIILICTLLAFIWYVAHNPSVIDAVRHLPPSLLISLIVLYFGVIGATALIFIATTRLCGVTISRQEGLLVTAYSAVINFFGPLQSGPAFRAVYLKSKYGVKLLNYTTATMLYYLFFAIISGVCLLSGVLGWWLVLCALVGIIVLAVIWHTNPRMQSRLKALHLASLGLLFLATLLQVALVAVIYYMELRHVTTGVTFSQAIIYTGAANFALFVSLTPGAIGFREAFLLFSQNLHHINNEAIVAANIIDRGVYLVILAILALYIFGTHAQRRLQAK